MLVDVLRHLRMPRRANRCELRPESRVWLEANGLGTARDFVDLPGVVVSGHVGRNVSRVEIDGQTCYLKREHRIRVRDRFRSWRAGFGWTSMSAREAKILRRLDENHLPGPKWVACGEADGEGFLLVAATENAVDLKSVPVLSDDLAERLGQVTAKLHAAGIDQPDLFAKHILVDRESSELTILDWQRATIRSTIPLDCRIRSLAALRATADDAVFTQRLWSRLVASYCRESLANGFAMPDARVVEAETGIEANRLSGRPGFRSQRASSVAQELVRIQGELVCAIPAVAEEMRDETTIATLYDPQNDGRTIDLVSGHRGVLRVGLYRAPLSRWWAMVRGRAWRSYELKTARLLFHLERNGILAPKLLAYGQVVPKINAAGSFVLMEPLESRSPIPKDREAVTRLLHRLHEAGCRLRGVAAIGMRGDEAIVCDSGELQLARRVTSAQVRRDFDIVNRYFAVQR